MNKFKKIYMKVTTQYADEIFYSTIFILMVMLTIVFAHNSTTTTLAEQSKQDIKLATANEKLNTIDEDLKNINETLQLF